MSKKKYGLAYCDRNGDGFSETEPFIVTDLNSYKHASDVALDLMADGVGGVVIAFSYTGELPESVTWKYVALHYESRMD